MSNNNKELLDSLQNQELNEVLRQDKNVDSTQQNSNAQSIQPTQQNQQDAVVDNQQISNSTAWVWYAVATAICFTACNTTISKITQEQGPLCLLYFSFGSMIAGAVYNVYHCTINFKKAEGKFWVNQNLIVDGQANMPNIIGFVIFCIVYFLIQNMAFLTMWFATLAGVNVGVITVIWTVTPLFMAIVDYLVFGTKLKYFHYIGMLLIVACTVLISLQPYILGEATGTSPDDSSVLDADSVSDTTSELFAVFPSIADADDDTISDDTAPSPAAPFGGLVVEPWVPVLFGIATPVTFVMNSVLIRKLCTPEYGMNFNGTDLSFTAYFCVNVIIIIFAIVWWQIYDYDEDMFLLGTIGSIINTVGICLNNKASSIGPLGPVTSITACANILLVIVESVRHLRSPTWVEFIALFLGLAGALELVFPSLMEKLFKCNQNAEEQEAADAIAYVDDPIEMKNQEEQD